MAETAKEALARAVYTKINQATSGGIAISHALADEIAAHADAALRAAGFAVVPLADLRLLKKMLDGLSKGTSPFTLAVLNEAKLVAERMLAAAEEPKTKPSFPIDDGRV